MGVVWCFANAKKYKQLARGSFKENTLALPGVVVAILAVYELTWL